MRNETRFAPITCRAYPDQAQTALILKRMNVTTLWRSYMGRLRSEQLGRAYFRIYSSTELVSSAGV